jgi:hypothetical protein
MVRAVFREKCQQNPGCLDGQLINYYGEVYIQSMHGDDPIGAGFDISVGASQVRMHDHPIPTGDQHLWFLLASLAYLAASVVSLYAVRRRLSRDPL